ncbi:hypothetical protein DXG01_004637, partial [Tephrocybe rancida]
MLSFLPSAPLTDVLRIEVGPYVRDKGAVQRSFHTFPAALVKYTKVYNDGQLQLYQGSETKPKIIRQPQVVEVSDEEEDDSLYHNVQQLHL